MVSGRFHDNKWCLLVSNLSYPAISKKKKKLKEEGKEGGKEGGEEIPISHFVKEKYQNKWDKILGLIMDLIFRAYLLSIALFQMTYF